MNGLLLHQVLAGVPCLAHFLASDIVTVLELVKDEGVDLERVNLAVLRQHLLLGGHIDDLKWISISPTGLSANIYIIAVSF